LLLGVGKQVDARAGGGDHDPRCIIKRGREKVAMFPPRGDIDVEETRYLVRRDAPSDNSTNEQDVGPEQTRGCPCPRGVSARLPYPLNDPS
jgi:hypothetical protein